jgi:hypothetical protein
LEPEVDKVLQLNGLSLFPALKGGLFLQKIPMGGYLFFGAIKSL